MSDERSEPVVDLAYVGRALQRLTAEVASLRDDMHVLTAIVQRIDNSQGRMLEDLNNHEADKNGAENTPEQSQHETEPWALIGFATSSEPHYSLL